MKKLLLAAALVSGGINACPVWVTGEVATKRGGVTKTVTINTCSISSIKNDYFIFKSGGKQFFITPALKTAILNSGTN